MNLERPYIAPHLLPETVRAKWADTALTEGFVPLPKKLLRTMTILFKGDEGMDELATLLAAADYKRPNSSRPPTLDFLANTSGLSKAKLEEALERLDRRGYITKHTDPAGRVIIDYPGFIVALEKAAKEETTSST